MSGSSPAAPAAPSSRSDGDARARAGVYALTWLAYAAAYLGRKPFAVAKEPLRAALSLSDGALAAIDTAYLAAYALGLLGMGPVGDRVGARRLVGWGLVACAASCALSGAVSSALALGLLAACAGVAQSTGWPGNNRAMAAWTPPARRGAVMGAWSTCYQVGGVGATALGALLLARPPFAPSLAAWRGVYLVPGALMLAVGLLVLARLRDRPAARSIDDRKGGSAVASGTPRRSAAPLPVDDDPHTLRRVLARRTLWCYAGAYFALKLVRYTLLFWLPAYLSRQLGWSPSRASLVSTAFEIGGVAGALGLGHLSDRLRRAPRALFAAASLLALAAALASIARHAPTTTVGNVLALALVGALLFGPDTLLAGTAAQEAGGPRAAATATGFVNGVGSLGAILQGAVTVAVTRRWGWPALFTALVAVALAGAAALVPALVGRRSDSAG